MCIGLNCQKVTNMLSQMRKKIREMSQQKNGHQSKAKQSFESLKVGIHIKYIIDNYYLTCR